MILLTLEFVTKLTIQKILTHVYADLIKTSNINKMKSNHGKNLVVTLCLKSKSGKCGE